MAGDANYGDVVLLLHGNGANASTSFTDNSPAPRAVTPAGNAQISTAQSQFGGSSMLFDGSGATLSIPYSTDFDIGTNYTIEAWVWKPATTDLCVVSSRNAGNINYHLFVGAYVSIDTISSGGTLSLAGTTAVTSNAWHHVAATKDGNTWRIFLDGNLEASGTVSGTYAATGVPIVVGATSAGYYFNGYIGDLRITKNVARHTASFTPPTEAFPDGSNSISGVVHDSSGALCARIVRAYRRDTGELMSATTSDAATGAYSLPCGSEEVTLVFLDNASSGTYYNDLAQRVIPA
jgi:hypothetical protein